MTPRKQAQRRTGIGGTTPDAGRDRQILLQMEFGAGIDGEDFAEAMRGAGDEIVVGRKQAGERPRQAQRHLRRRSGCQFVAMLREGEQRLDRMIAVRAPAADVEGEIDLGEGRFAESAQGFAPPVASPEASLALMRAASFSSA